MSEAEVGILVDLEHYKKLLKKYPLKKKYIEKEVERWGNIFTKSRKLFQAKQGKHWLEEIKETIYFSDYEEEKQNQKESKQHIPQLTKEEYLQAKKELFGEEPFSFKKYSTKTLEEYKEILHKWFYYTDEEIIDIQLATLIGEKIPGDPLWTFVIAPPGGLKTETLRPFQVSEDFYPLSDLTPKTFISGLMIGTGENRRKIEDLLPQLNKKVLIFKDFTTILEKNKEARQEIMAQLREIYDGSFAKRVGTSDTTIRHKARFGLIAGVTPIIDKYWKVMQQLGERFLKVRWEEDIVKVTKRAREMEGKEEKMRKELNEVAMGFMQGLNYEKIPEFNDNLYGEKLDQVARFVAIGRTPVSISDGRGDFYYDFIPMPERPTRLVKQLKKMCKCLALIRGKREVEQEEITTIMRIARDTMPQDRLKVLEIISKNQNRNINGCYRPILYKNIKLPTTSLIRILDQLYMLDLVVNTEIKEDYGNPEHYLKVPEWIMPLLSTPIFSVATEKVTAECVRE